MLEKWNITITVGCLGVSTASSKGEAMHLAGEASKVWGRVTGSWLAGWWHTSVSSPALLLPWEFWIRKLDESLSGFCCGHRKIGQVEEGSENLPILHPRCCAQCPRTPPPNYSLKFGNWWIFPESISFLLLCFSSTSLLSIPGSHRPASVPLHLLFSWQVPGETAPSAQKSLPQTTASKTSIPPFTPILYHLQELDCRVQWAGISVRFCSLTSLQHLAQCLVRGRRSYILFEWTLNEIVTLLSISHSSIAIKHHPVYLFICLLVCRLSLWLG